MKNYWATTHTSIVSWQAFFSDLPARSKLDALKSLVSQIMEAGERYEVFQITQVDGHAMHNNQAYMDYITDKAKREGVFSWPIGCTGHHVFYQKEPPEKMFEFEFFFFFKLRTDIWFPKVHGYLDTRTSLKQTFDNSELAYCHTPRLNHFLAVARQAVLDIGGTWEVDTENAISPYYESITETGIRLD